jgi:hypothetical protein
VSGDRKAANSTRLCPYSICYTRNHFALAHHQTLQSEMDTLAKSAESAIVNAYNAGDKKGTFAVKVKRLCCRERLQQYLNPEFGHPSVRLVMHRC